MKKVLIASGLLALTMGATPAVLAKGGADKVFACHITGINFAGTHYEGHVIHVSTKAVAAHCSHDGIPDHHPIGVIKNAKLDCQTDDLSSRCVVKAATGQACSRRTGAVGPVDLLCN
jgi:hypothetical protein